MDHSLVWAEIVLMPSTPRRDPKAHVNVAETNPLGREAVVRGSDITQLKRQIETTYSKRDGCTAADESHHCVSIHHTAGTYANGEVWVRIVLYYDRDCFQPHTEQEDLYHNVANWLNQTRARRCVPSP